MANTTYRIIGYGHANHGFFNQFYFESKEQHAYIVYQACLSDPELDGAVLIEVNHEDWRVIEEFDSGYPISVVFTEVGTFRVEKAPTLVML